MKSVFAKLAKKGVKIRIAAPLTKESKEAAKELSEFAEVRHIDEKDVNSRFCVVDGKQLTFMLMDDKDVHPTYDVGIWVNTMFFSNALESMFESKWKGLNKLE
jgi:hypothetical protein